MRLNKLRISNFRSYGPTETVIDFEDITTFIGANSSGKSAALQALTKLFGETNADRALEKSDFYVSHDEVLEDLERRELYIEANFSFPEIENDEGETHYAIPTYFDNFVVENTGEPPFLRIRLQATWEQSNTPDGIIESKVNYLSLSEDAEEVATKIPPSELSQIKIIYVPAIRNPSTLLRNATGTLLWRVLKSINWSIETKENIKDQLNRAEESLFKEAGLERVRDSLKDHWKKYHKDIRYSEANIRFNSTDLDQLIKKFEVDFMPSITQKAYSIDSLGDGLRSLFYLSLVDSFLEIEQQAMENNEDEDAPLFNIQIPALTILAIEEPENHVSPHLLGNIILNLNRIASKNNSQVILTSHTPAIVKRVLPESIRYFNISVDEVVTKVKKIVLPRLQGSAENEEAYKYVKEAVRAYPEIYFSKLVILGEGDSEEIVIPKAIELETEDHLDSISVSVVPLGGRHVNHFWKLLNELEIPYVTLLDLDKERNGGGWGRIRYALSQLIKIGVDKSELLSLMGGSILSDEDLSDMHTWDESYVDNQMSWLQRLESYDIYFSSPLDLDFMMLEAFPDAYKRILRVNEGPRIDKVGKVLEIENDEPELPEYLERVSNATKHALKEGGSSGDTYTIEQKKLMVWYDYFFLQRGKPVTHRLAILNITDELFKERLPEPLKRLIASVKQKISGE
ncbi:ATP-dependent nuclease [Paenibacillus pinistramenti]|uniref:ATP-dependent nuclease n=1 Tax=Paenibacillus pinistramenti TaxID=1768003 RepID=UPI001108F6EA|nr:AAA family ATPase [Paenibacillus pinistramenti]